MRLCATVLPLVMVLVLATTTTQWPRAGAVSLSRTTRRARQKRRLEETSTATVSMTAASWSTGGDVASSPVPGPSCSAHGAYSASVGACVCESPRYTGSRCDLCALDHYGPQCQHCTAQDNCHSFGVCAVDGTTVQCQCQVGYASANCGACAPGHYGFPVCRACDRVHTCSNHGTCDELGRCVCDPHFASSDCSTCVDGAMGPSCTVSCDAASTCGARGVCDPTSGACVCRDKYAGAHCEECAKDRYGFPACSFCKRNTTCHGRGVCRQDGTCACEPGYAGLECAVCAASEGYKGKAPFCYACDEATTCSGHGVCRHDGSAQAAAHPCVCNVGWTTHKGSKQQCSQCDKHFFGAACGPCPEGMHGNGSAVCSNRGVCDDGLMGTGTCACEESYGGVACELSRATHCHGHGKPKSASQCTCDAGFASPFCEDCMAGHFGADCAQVCPGGLSSICSNAGVCHDGRVGNGTCACIEGRSGDSCQFSKDFCHGNGLAPPEGPCTCEVGWNFLSNCSDCLAGFFGPRCKPCPSVTCSGHGHCDDGVTGSGQCTCIDGFGGPTCDLEDVVVCRGLGEVQPDGHCVCRAPQHAGHDCGECADGFDGYPTCAPLRCTGGDGRCSTIGRLPCTTSGPCGACLAGTFGSPAPSDADDCCALDCAVLHRTGCRSVGEHVMCGPCVPGFDEPQGQSVLDACIPDAAVHVDGDAMPVWSDWSSCSVPCGEGLQTRTCVATDPSQSCAHGAVQRRCFAGPCNACLDSPCFNGGVCTPSGEAFACTCVAPFAGARCELDRKAEELQSAFRQINERVRERELAHALPGNDDGLPFSGGHFPRFAAKDVSALQPPAYEDVSTVLKQLVGEKAFRAEQWAARPRPGEDWTSNIERRVDRLAHHQEDTFGKVSGAALQHAEAEAEKQLADMERAFGNIE